MQVSIISNNAQPLHVVPRALSVHYSDELRVHLNGSIYNQYAWLRSYITLSAARETMFSSRNTDIVSANGEKCPDGIITSYGPAGLTVHHSVRIIATIR